LNPQAGCRTGFVASWIKLLDAPLARVQSLSCEPVVAQETLEREAIRESLRRLETFPFVAQWRAAGALELVGARFDILTGHLEVLDHFNSAFEPVQ
jgi:carbonic anhydrase